MSKVIGVGKKKYDVLIDEYSHTWECKAPLIRLMDFLEMYHVNLLICSNGINTASGLYKIFIQIFAVIAEFERDTLTERIVDNMMELAKDGRWLGGNTPMGFTVRRVTTGTGKGKSAYSYLESLPEEKRMVQRLYEIFRTTRSIQTTAKQMNEEGFHTPSGAAFNASTTNNRRGPHKPGDRRNRSIYTYHPRTAHRALRAGCAENHGKKADPSVFT